MRDEEPFSSDGGGGAGMPGIEEVGTPPPPRE